MSEVIRIMIADDHLVFRMGLKTLLAIEPDLDLVGEARSGTECVDLYQAVRPDVVLMDLRMSGGGGLAALAAIRKEDPRARVLILTSYGTEEEIYQALHLGAMGYVLKDIGQDELVAAIRSVQARKKCIPPDIAIRLAERLPRQTLSAREIETLKLVVKGLVNREIAEVLGVSMGTVKSQLNALFMKLEVTDRTEAATVALRRGIVQME